MATSLTLGPALTHCSAAPRPRPPRGLPQPIKPTRITSSPPACTLARLLMVAATAADVFRKSRREEVEATRSRGFWFKIRLLLERNAANGVEPALAGRSWA